LCNRRDEQVLSGESEQPSPKGESFIPSHRETAIQAGKSSIRPPRLAAIPG
jgi:hypothetical protein